VDDNIFFFHNRVVTACPRYFLERVENLPKCQSCLWFGGTAFEK
jgi:predicted transcriptional regulator